MVLVLQWEWQCVLYGEQVSRLECFLWIQCLYLYFFDECVAIFLIVGILLPRNAFWIATGISFE